MGALLKTTRRAEFLDAINSAITRFDLRLATTRERLSVSPGESPRRVTLYGQQGGATLVWGASSDWPSTASSLGEIEARLPEKWRALAISEGVEVTHPFIPRSLRASL